MTTAQHVTTIPRRGRTEHRVSARTDSSGAAVVDAAGSPVLFHPTWNSVSEGLPGPAELLASALAACLLQNLSRAHDLMGFEYDAAEVDVVVEHQQWPPRFVAMAYTLRVTTDEPEQRVAEMHALLREHGGVYNTLASVCDVRGTVEAVSGTPPYGKTSRKKWTTQ